VDQAQGPARATQIIGNGDSTTDGNVKHLEFYAGKQTLVTGGLGFIGSNLAIRLLDLGAHVLVVDAVIPETGANPFNIESVHDHPRLSVRTVDVRDVLAMDRLVRNKEVIFNLAGQVSHIDSMQDPFTDLEINCRSQLALLESCRHNAPHTKVIFSSTRQIYGRVPEEDLPVDERRPPNPVDVNGINKLAGERYHVLYNNVYGIRSSVLRLTNTYGPHMLVKNNRQTALGWLIRQAMDGEDIAIFGDGSQLRDFTYVDDAVDAFLNAGANDAANGQVFNVGGLEPISLREVTELLVEIAGTGSYHLVPFPPERKAIDIGSIYVDDRKIRRVLRWRPYVDMRAGLERTVEFYRTHRQHYWATHAAVARV
jgi:UDP-glucose 4-epimerase